MQLNLKDYKLLIVKSGYLSPDLQNLSVPSFMILTDGADNQNLQQIENQNRKKPIYPFQKDHDFVPRVSNGIEII